MNKKETDDFHAKFRIDFWIFSVTSCKAKASARQHSVLLPDPFHVNMYHPSVISWQRKQAGIEGV